MINLGIVVVYVVPKWYEAMLTLHLRQIERHTHMPYNIFGCAVRSSAEALRILRSNSSVRLCECLPTTATGSGEHSHYLECLTKIAIDAGVTHVVTLHVDSFPIHDGWVDTMMNKLLDLCPFVTGEGANTACLMFSRQFYLRYRPTFLPTDAERSQPSFRDCVSKWKLRTHSGVGYAFRAYQHGLAACYMPEVHRKNSLASVYAQQILHFNSGFRITRPIRSKEPGLWYSACASILAAACHVFRGIVPANTRQAIRNRLGRKILESIDQPRIYRSCTRLCLEREALLANPDGYIAQMLAQPNKASHPKSKEE